MPRKAKAGACDAGLHGHCRYFGPLPRIEKIPATQALDARAEGFIRDLIAAGAFDLEIDGARWFHNVLPGCRDACRRIKAQHDLTAPGMTVAICRAIGRLKSEAA